MPLIANSSYRSSLLLKSGHLSTMYPWLFRKVDKINYQRERILTTDQDFLDLDWACCSSSRLIILTHGLEGSSYSSYCQGFVASALESGWDVLAWNMRGCSGVPNLKLKSYHSGSSDDLQLVFSHALFKKRYSEICLVGFSLGGNITLKFLGEQGNSIAGLISAAVAISVPCDLEGAALNASKFQNSLYLSYFLKSMRTKLKAKQSQFPNYLVDKNPDSLKNFYDFDNYYTAPVHGFRTAKEYWQTCSSKHFIRSIEVPTLIINAQDDPLLTPSCYPIAEAKDSKVVSLEIPREGGHVGFKLKRHKTYWSEFRALQFLAENASSALESSIVSQAA